MFNSKAKSVIGFLVASSALVLAFYGLSIINPSEHEVPMVEVNGEMVSAYDVLDSLRTQSTNKRVAPSAIEVLRDDSLAADFEATYSEYERMDSLYSEGKRKKANLVDFSGVLIAVVFFLVGFFGRALFQVGNQWYFRPALDKSDSFGVMRQRIFRRQEFFTVACIVVPIAISVAAFFV